MQITESLILTAEVFWKIACLFAPFALFGALGMALVEKIDNLKK